MFLNFFTVFRLILKDVTFPVEFVAAFDVNDKKVGFDLSNAIFAHPNNTAKIIIYSRYKYITLLFSKLFNFDVEFSFIHSKYNTKYTDDDLEKFKNGTTNIL